MLTVPPTFRGAFHGTLNTYERAYDFAGDDTGMQQRGTWVIPWVDSFRKRKTRTALAVPYLATAGCAPVLVPLSTRQSAMEY